MKELFKAKMHEKLQLLRDLGNADGEGEGLKLFSAVMPMLNSMGLKPLDRFVDAHPEEIYPYIKLVQAHLAEVVEAFEKND
jgi:hypothetical protein